MERELLVQLTDMRLRQVAATIRHLMNEGDGDGLKVRLGEALSSVANARAILREFFDE